MSDSAMSDRDRAVLRHMIATLAYRAGKVLRGAPAGFGDFAAPGALNTPRVLLAHVVDLVEWARRFCTGDEDAYVISEPTTWDRAVQTAPLPASLERVFQAPIADALTHIGQLALLRRMAGAPVLGESYRRAEIVVGRVGPDQAPPGREFALDRGALWRPKDPTGN
jgi:hypothetical protein